MASFAQILIDLFVASVVLVIVAAVVAGIVGVFGVAATAIAAFLTATYAVSTLFRSAA